MMDDALSIRITNALHLLSTVKTKLFDRKRNKESRDTYFSFGKIYRSRNNPRRLLQEYTKPAAAVVGKSK